MKKRYLTSHSDSFGMMRLGVFFETFPDAPIGKVVLTMAGGKRGLLENSQNICAGTQKATVKLDAQNGKTRDLEPALRAKCPQAKGHHKKRGRGR